MHHQYPPQPRRALIRAARKDRVTQPPPSFESIARFCLGNGFELDIEIKPSPGVEAETGRVVAHHAARLWAAEGLKPLLSSFRPDALAAAQRAEPTLPRALLLDTLREGWFAEAQALACVAVVFNYTLIDAELLARVHSAGMRTLCYTVNDPATAQWLSRAGIDGIITDAVDRFAPREAVHASPA